MGDEVLPAKATMEVKGLKQPIVVEGRITLA